jgi:sarcosine oxidase
MPTTRRFNVIVLGVGTMGSAACYHLAKRGVNVLGLEQFSIPHERGSGHGESRITRLCYYEHADYVPLLKRAYELWDQLGEEAGCRILHRIGGIFMGRHDGAFIRETLRAADLHDLPCERVDRSQLAREHSQFHLPDDHVALFEPNAGYVLPEPAITMHAELAMRAGAELHAHEAVRSWTAHDDRVEVVTDRAAYSAEKLIICGGAWMGRIARDLNLPLTVTRQVLGWVQPLAPDRFRQGSFPVWAIENDDGSLHYGFPILPGRIGLKVAHHVHGEPTDPETIDRLPRPHDEDDFRGVLRMVLPEADGPLLAMRICMYTNTPDSHFVIDTHPRCDRVHFAGGFSGHGFKFAPVIGEILADLAMHAQTKHPIDFLSMKRFASGTGS